MNNKITLSVKETENTVKLIIGDNKQIPFEQTNEIVRIKKVKDAQKEAEAMEDECMIKEQWRVIKFVTKE